MWCCNCSNVVEKEAIVESIANSTEKITIIDKQKDNSESSMPKINNQKILKIKKPKNQKNLKIRK